MVQMVGMVQGGGGLRFALEAREGLVIFGDIIGEEFEGDVAVEANVFGFVDDAHAAATEFFDDAVMGDSLADEGVGVSHSADIRLHVCGKSTTWARLPKLR